MGPRSKAILIAASGLLALLAGLWLSGWLTLALLGLDGVALRWNLYLDYLRAIDAPQVQAYARRIRVAGCMGFGVALLAWLAVCVAALKPARRTLHGEARFARAGELSGHGLFRDATDALVVGKSGRRLLRFGGQQFALLAAPTRSGKGVGIVIPNLLQYGESVVVLDIKQENFDLTSGWRARQGHAVYLFNPFAQDRRSHRWNPLSYVSEDPAFRLSDILAIAAMLYPDGSDEQKFWVSQARNAFAAFAMALFEKRDVDLRDGFPYPAQPTLGAVFRLSSGDGGDAKTGLRILAQQPHIGPRTALALQNLVSQADDTFASILGTLREPLNPWLNPVLDAATSGDDFDLRDVRRKRMAIYIGIAPDKLAEARGVLNLFFSQLIQVNTRTLPSADPTLRHPCLLLMDEFTAVGKLDILASSVAYMAGYNLRLLPIIQSLAQLDATYGKEVARTLVTNHALQILYAPREQQDANDYSEMLGYTTVRRQNITRGREVTRNQVEERRALMLPQELKALGADRQVLVLEDLPHPVLCQKIRYYKDKRFTARLLPKAPVPLLQIDLAGSA